MLTASCLTGGDGVQPAVHARNARQGRHVPHPTGHVQLPRLLHRHAPVGLPAAAHPAAARQRQGLPAAWYGFRVIKRLRTFLLE